MSKIPQKAKFRPDYAVVPAQPDLPFPRKSMMPGDAKQSRKWNHQMGKRYDAEFKKPLCQMLFYSQNLQTRYAFIITDAEYACLRWTLPAKSSISLAQSRPRRELGERSKAVARGVPRNDSALSGDSKISGSSGS